MKKVCILLVMAICLSLCGCTYIQAGIADNVIDKMGKDEGKSFEEHQEFFQAQWDAFFGSIDYLISIMEDAENGEDYFKNKLDSSEDFESIESIEDLESMKGSNEESQPTIDWEAAAAAENVTLGNIKDENGFTEPYKKDPDKNRFTTGHCTWYAYGRFSEVTGIDLKLDRGDAKTWLDVCNDDRVYIERDRSKISAPAIAVDYKPGNSAHAGHVTFIEHVTYDEQGNPVDVYFSECNWDINKQYDEGTDGIVKKASYNEFIHRGDHEVKGFIIPK